MSCHVLVSHTLRDRKANAELCASTALSRSSFHLFCLIGKEIIFNIFTILRLEPLLGSAVFEFYRNHTEVSLQVKRGYLLREL